MNQPPEPEPLEPQDGRCNCGSRDISDCVCPETLAQMPDFVANGYKMTDKQINALMRLNE